MCKFRLGGCVFSIFLLALVPTCACYGQQIVDARLTIAFANGQSQFRVGEIIPLDLTFSTSTEKTYLWSGGPGYYGCYTPERFRVSPPGRDPLSRLHGSFPGGILCSILSSGPLYLGRHAQVVHEDLNDWVALRGPGQYSLFVTSRRLRRRVESKLAPVELRSNTLYFRIVAASPEWQARVLASATAVLEDPGTAPKEKGLALHTLRYLDTPGSVSELVRQLSLPGNKDSQDCVDGLLGSEYQQLVLRDLATRFAAPDAAVTQPYVTVFAESQFLASHEPMRVFPSRDVKQQAQWTLENRRRLHQLQDMENGLFSRAADLIPTKEGLAQAETLRTLVTRPGVPPSDPKAALNLPGDAIASAFLRMSPQQQAEILRFFWERIRVPAIAWALEDVLNETWIANRKLRDIALRRLYELDPEEGAARILEEIQRPHLDLGNATVSAQTLSLLQDRKLPQLDSLLATRLAEKDSKTMELDAQLIGRYATQAILPQVRAVYLRAPGKWDGVIEDGLLVYFLRTDPGFALQRMQLATNLWTPEAYRLAVRMGLWPKIEPAIIAKLDDPKSSVAAQAAADSSQYGDAKAEKALWARLRRFHGKWTKLGKNFVYGPDLPHNIERALALQQELVEAIGQAQNWLLDGDQFRELEGLTFGQEREEVARWRWRSPLELDLDFAGGRFFANIGSIYHTRHVDSLRAKLSQFPEGTQFRISASGPADRLAPVIHAVERAAQQDGLAVEIGKDAR